MKARNATGTRLNPLSLLSSNAANVTINFVQLPALLVSLSLSHLCNITYTCTCTVYVLWLLNMKFGDKRNDVVANLATIFS